MDSSKTQAYTQAVKHVYRQKHANHPRTCIAVPKLKIDEPVEIVINKNKIENKRNKPINLEMHNGKLYCKLPYKYYWQSFVTNSKNFYENCNKKMFLGATGTAAFALTSALMTTQLSLGYETYLNGQSIGIARDAEYTAAVLQGMEGEIEDALGYDFEGDVQTEIRVVPNGNFTAHEDMKQSIRLASGTMVLAYALIIDGQPVLAMDSDEALEGIIEEYRNSYNSNDMIGAAVFGQSYTIEYKEVPVDKLAQANDAAAILGTDTQRFYEHTLTAPASIESLAEATGMSADSIAELNPGLGAAAATGQRVTLAHSQPLLSVCTVERVTETKSIPFGVEKVNDDKLYVGQGEITAPGTPGETQIVKEIHKVNGEIATTEILSQRVIVEPITQIESVGTKEKRAGVSSGSFIHPFPAGITSSFGRRRSEFHTGVDFGGKSGSDIKAADGGTVILAGVSGNYGNLVKIDHGNGYVTYYAHCSKLYVSQGDKVNKGDVISAIGSTGRSTGPHLHFEIRKNGEILNPMNFI